MATASVSPALCFFFGASSAVKSEPLISLRGIPLKYFSKNLLTITSVRLTCSVKMINESKINLALPENMRYCVFADI